MFSSKNMFTNVLMGLSGDEKISTIRLAGLTQYLNLDRGGRLHARTFRQRVGLKNGRATA